jgi:diaminohydroxyphosphoribosylaminopyrimidine deaminase/5-amino-6-(5-phosphoribosylamino)uracil reductase
MEDPDPRVSGAGLERLRAAGLLVELGLLAEAAEDVTAGFLNRLRAGRPLVTLKLATTLDGKIATASGESQWITGEPARRAAHLLRGQSDAVLVGVGTVTVDNPQLTCRLPGVKHVPMVRVVADSHLRTRLTASLVATARDNPTWIIHREGAEFERKQALAAAGVRLIEVRGSSMGIDLAKGLAALGEAGITRLLVEGGAQIAAALLRERLVDRIAWFHAPGVMGGDGWPAAQAFGVKGLADMPRFERVASMPCGDDMLTELRVVR